MNDDKLDSPAKIAADLRAKVEVCRRNGGFCAAEYRKHYSLNEASEAWSAMESNLRAIAARVEALGRVEIGHDKPFEAEPGAICQCHHCTTFRSNMMALEPSEREVVRQATLQAKTLSEWINSCFNNAELCADPECEPCDGVRKLTGIIAALAPIAERKEGT